MAIQIAFTINAWSKALGISERTLAIKLTKSGHSIRGREVSAKQILDALTGEKDASLIRLNDAKSTALEQKQKIKDGLLVELPTAERILWAELLGPLKQELDAMPQKLAPMVNPDSAQSAQKILFAWVEDTKKKLLKGK